MQTSEPGLVGGSSDDPEDRRLLDVARAEFVEHGFRRVSISDIAMRAGVSRRTIHRRFGEKDRLVLAVVEREALEFFAKVASAVSELDTPRERATEGFVAGMRECRSNPLILAVQRFEPQTLAMALTGDDALAAARAAAAMLLADDTLSLDDAQWAAEIMGRLTVSLVLSPTPVVPVDTDANARAFAERLFGPLLDAARRSSGA